MATSGQPNSSPISRKFVKLLIAVVAVILVYSGAWYWAATALDDRIKMVLETRNPFGANIECADQQLRGYPFRIGLFCTSLKVDDHKNGISASFGSFRSAAQIYAPGHIVWELDGPGTVRSSSGVAAALEWKTLHSSVVTRMAGIERSSVETEELKVALTTTPDVPTIDLLASHVESHVRQNDGDLDYAVLVRDMSVNARGGSFSLPKVSTSLDATFSGQAGLIDFRGAKLDSLRGLEGELRRFVADIGDGRALTLSGPLSIGPDGLVSGKLRVEVENLSGWAVEAKKYLRDAEDTIDNATSILGALAGGNDSAKIDLRIEDGDVILGFFKIATIPPL